MLFVLACDTARCTERETSNAHLNAADRKSCRGTERHSHSFPLNNIIAYLSQIIVNVHNDFALGYKLCIVHFSAKRLSFRGSNTVCMLSGVVVPREVGILLIYAPNFFFLKARQRMNDLCQTVTCKLVLHI